MSDKLPLWKIYLRTQELLTIQDQLTLIVSASDSDIEEICRGFSRLFAKSRNGVANIVARSKSPNGTLTSISVSPHAKNTVLVLHERDGQQHRMVRKLPKGTSP